MAKELRERLNKIGTGEMPLSPVLEETSNDQAIVISEPAKTKSSFGKFSI